MRSITKVFTLCVFLICLLPCYGDEIENNISKDSTIIRSDSSKSVIGDIYQYRESFGSSSTIKKDQPLNLFCLIISLLSLLCSLFAIFSREHLTEKQEKRIEEIWIKQKKKDIESQKIDTSYYRNNPKPIMVPRNEQNTNNRDRDIEETNKAIDPDSIENQITNNHTSIPITKPIYLYARDSSSDEILAVESYQIGKTIYKLILDSEHASSGIIDLCLEEPDTKSRILLADKDLFGNVCELIRRTRCPTEASSRQGTIELLRDNRWRVTKKITLYLN